MSTPPSYATADEARAYVARLAARPRPPRPAPVYLIAPSSMLKSAPWPRLRYAVGELLPGCPLLEFGDVFGGEFPGAEDRIPAIAERAAGAVVIPRTVPGDAGLRYLIGYAARLEASALAGMGRAVLVFAPGGMLAWPDVRVRKGKPPVPAFSPFEVDLPPIPPGGVLLPTVAASYRALGLADPAPRRPPRPKRNGRKPRPAVP